MSIDDFIIKMKTINQDYEKSRLSLLKEFALSNNPCKIGDIIQDHIGKLKIEKINWYITHSPSIPSACVYSGLELKKDGTPAKRQDGRKVYQTNLR